MFTLLCFLSNGLGKGAQCAETEHGLCAVGLEELHFKANDLLFALKISSLLQRIYFDSLCAFVLEGSVVPNLTSGVIELPTVLQTALGCNDGFGPLLSLGFEVVFL